MTKKLVASIAVAVVASLCIGVAVLSSDSTAVGQAPSDKEAAPPANAAKPLATAKPQPAPQVQSAAASPALTVPPAEVLLVLIRTTLLALNQAVQTGNFTVLRDLGSPDLQAANSPAQLGIIFADLRNRNIDLSPVAIVAPEVSEPPTITPQNMLRLVGFFPTQPLQIQFQMLFQPVNGQWRLFGMAVDAVSPSTTPAVTAQETPPATKVSAPIAAKPATTPKPAAPKKDKQP
jgi:hypothetical protein